MNVLYQQITCLVRKEHEEKSATNFKSAISSSIYIYIFFFNKCVLFLRHNFQITEHIFRIFVFVILFIGPV